MIAPEMQSEAVGVRGRPRGRVQRVTSFEQFCAQAREWRELAARCAQPTLFQDHEFIASWWRGFGADVELLVVNDGDGSWLGALPVQSYRERYRGVPVRVLSCVENGYIPTCRALLRDDCREVALASLCQHLLSFTAWDLVRFPKLPVGCFEQTFLLNQAHQRRVLHGARANLTTPVIRLSEGWSGLLQTRSKGFRKQLRNKCNRFRKAAGTRIEAHPFDRRRAPALIHAMSQVSAASWKRNLGTDLSADGRVPRFLFEIATRLGDSGRATAWFAYQHDVPIAFELNLEYRGVTFPIRADFDERYRELSPGFVLMVEVLASLDRKRDARVYYSCANAYDYLLRWTDETVVHETLELFARRLLPLTCHTLSHQLAPRLRGVRRAVRAARHSASSLVFGSARP